MNRIFPVASTLIIGAALLGTGGCSDAAKPPPRFQIDPEQAAQEAMRLYDKNQDDTLDAKELEASPPLAEMLLNLKARDPAHADSLTADDIRRRLVEWNKSSNILAPALAVVYLDDQPLVDATVTFVPEPFLGGSYHAHHGTTNQSGACQLDAELAEYPGLIYVGLYRVRISKLVNGKESIPPQYNVHTTLAREIAEGIRNSRETVFFRLKSK